MRKRHKRPPGRSRRREERACDILFCCSSFPAASPPVVDASVPKKEKLYGLVLPEVTPEKPVELVNLIKFEQGEGVLIILDLITDFSQVPKFVACAVAKEALRT